MSQFIKRLEAIGIHGRFDINLDFQDGINIVHGSNGTGKTTLLHILANAVNEDFRRFGYLKFQKLIITLDDDREILITQQDYPNEPLQTLTTISIDRRKVDSYCFSQLLEEESQEGNSEMLIPQTVARYISAPFEFSSSFIRKFTYVYAYS